MLYDLQALGCVLNGNPANAASNTAIFLKAIQDAKGGNPGPIYVPMGAGLAVLNGKLDLNGANMVLKGEAGMGTVSDWGATSLIRGFGPGDTLNVTQGGCKVSGLCWQGDGQSGSDAFIRVRETQVDLRDMLMDGPNVGISIQHKLGTFIGQSWTTNVLMVGKIKAAAMDINAGEGAVRLSHVRVFNGTMQPTDPQPPHGILVRYAGELMIDSCDIDNCGTNLAIVPGIDGQANSYVQNLDIVNSDFDNGNGDGQILIRPQGSSFVLNTQIVNGWCSSVNNGLQPNGTTWPANGMTIDGSRSHPAAGFSSICNVSVDNSVFQNSIGHCGIYASTVQGLTIGNGCGAWNNFNGFQTFKCSGSIAGVKAGNYAPSALGAGFFGNKAYGVLLEKSNMKFNPNDNALDGNGLPPNGGPWKLIP